ncbi:NADH-quinone oxidoreductase subunit H, partial [Arthrospira sp. PCC 8006]
MGERAIDPPPISFFGAEIPPGLKISRDCEDLSPSNVILIRGIAAVLNA